MCIPCEAAKERLMAACRLRDAVENRFGFGPALKAVYSPPPPDLDLDELARELSPNNSRTY